MLNNKTQIYYKNFCIFVIFYIQYGIIKNINFWEVKYMDEIIQALKGFWPLLLLLAFFYFGMYRPQKKQQKAADEMHAGMQAGDSVLTTSGFYGVIIDIMDDTVIVEFGNNRNCRIPMQKDAIAAVEKPNLTKTEEE